MKEEEVVDEGAIILTPKGVILKAICECCEDHIVKSEIDTLIGMSGVIAEYLEAYAMGGIPSGHNGAILYDGEEGGRFITMSYVGMENQSEASN